MESTSFSVWATLLILFTVLGTIAWFLGEYYTQLLLRLGNRSRKHSFEKWGVLGELFRPRGLSQFVLLGIGISLLAVFWYFATLSTFALATGNSVFDGNLVNLTLYVAVMVFLFGHMKELGRTSHILVMVRRLDDLKPEFHRRFTISELISIYESLRHSPGVIWEEFANLSTFQINHRTYDKYRLLGEPFLQRQTVVHSRTGNALTTIALVIAAVGVMTAIWSALD